jgi:CelD/BcsL family acetyltransferase involved in cellulose biosynthesis
MQSLVPLSPQVFGTSGRLIYLNTIGELRAAAADWDDLWQRSDCTSPLARAEPVADWIAHFAPGSRFRALVVADEERWLMALPLIGRRMAGLLQTGVLPCNAWPSGATLLWDVSATEDITLSDNVALGLAGLSWPVFLLEAAMPRRASWRALYRALTAAGMPYDLRTRWDVGRLPIEHDWHAAFGRLSRRHRQRITASLRKLSERGEVRFRLHADLAPDEVEPLLCRAWAIDNCGWKGAAGTSVLRTPGIAEFMLAQARWLAEEGRLVLAFLDCGERNIAFCYGVLGKGVFHSFKIGYDPAFALLSPGHLLQYHLQQALHADPGVTAIDFMGLLSEYHASWRPEPYPFARLAFAPRNSILGRAALWGFQQVRGPSEGLPAVEPAVGLFLEGCGDCHLAEASTKSAGH